MQNFRDKFRYQANQRGFSLMEVLIGIAIFAIGMLALASLQGALTRSTAEAKVRTTAINIAEQIIEGQRGFASVFTGTAYSYADIVDVTSDLPITFDSEMSIFQVQHFHSFSYIKFVVAVLGTYLHVSGPPRNYVFAKVFGLLCWCPCSGMGLKTPVRCIIALI